MKKREAINFINNKIKTSLNNQNTIFSNPSSTLPIWWLEAANKKFGNEFYILLNHAELKKFLLFKIPKAAIDKSVFYQREDLDKSAIFIPISDTDYVDRNGFNFNKFIIQVVDYE
jgi:hypothetical protein